MSNINQLILEALDKYSRTTPYDAYRSNVNVNYTTKDAKRAFTSKIPNDLMGQDRLKFLANKSRSVKDSQDTVSARSYNARNAFKYKG